MLWGYLKGGGNIDRRLLWVFEEGGKVGEGLLRIMGGRQKWMGRDTNVLELALLQNSVKELDGLRGVCDGRVAAEVGRHCDVRWRGTWVRLEVVEKS